MTNNSEEYGQLARRLVHDFNNLFTTIKGYSSLALHLTDPDDRIRGYLEEITKAAERAMELTPQLWALGGMRGSEGTGYETQQEEAQHE